jgi:hypothetical protein
MTCSFKIELPECLPTTHGPLGNRAVSIMRILGEVADWPTVAGRFPHAHEILSVLGPTLGRMVFVLDQVLGGEYHVDHAPLTDAAIFEVFKQDVTRLAAFKAFFEEERAA